MKYKFTVMQDISVLGKSDHKQEAHGPHPSPENKHIGHDIIIS